MKIAFGHVNLVNKYAQQLLVFASILIIKTSMVTFLPGLVMVTGGDEIGTIASAAFFAGLDWSGVISEIAYYGIGFSAFMSPLFRLGLSPQAIHFWMLFYGTVCLGLCGVICYNVLHNFLSIENKLFCFILSFASVFFPNNIMMTNYIMNEGILFLVNWLVLYILFILCRRSQENKQNNLHSLLLSAVLCYGFLVHTRAVFLWGATVVFLVIQYSINKKRILHLRVFLPSFAFFFIVARRLIDYVQTLLWLKGDIPLQNDLGFMGSYTERFNGVFSISGFKGFIRIIIGHVYGMFIQSYGLIIILALFFLYILYGLARRKTRSENWTLIQNNKEIALGIIYVLSLLAAVMLITALTMATNDIVENSGVLKWFVYTRYWAIAASPAIMFSTVILYRQKMSKAFLYVIPVCFSFISILFLCFVAPLFVDKFVLRSAIFYDYYALLLKRNNEVFTSHDFYLISVLCIIIATIIIILFMKKKQIAAILCITALFLYSGWYMTLVIQKEHSINMNDEFSGILSILSSVKTTVYRNNDIGTNINSMSRFNLLFNLYNHRIIPYTLMSGSHLFESGHSVLILNSALPTSRYLNVEYNMIESENPKYILISKDDKELCRQISIEGYNVKELDCIFIKAADLLYNIPPEYRVKKGSQTLLPNQAQFGPYIFLDRGKYRISVIGEGLDTADFWSYTWIGNEYPHHELKNIIQLYDEITYEINVTTSGLTEFFTVAKEQVCVIEGIWVRIINEL